MKTSTEMLTDMGWLDVATLFRERMGGKLVAIRDKHGNGHGRVELLDEELPPALVYGKQEKPYRGR